MSQGENRGAQEDSRYAPLRLSAVEWLLSALEARHRKAMRPGTEKEMEADRHLLEPAVAVRLGFCRRGPLHQTAE